MKPRWNLVLISLLSLASAGAKAQAAGPAPPPLTLRQAIDRALGQNPQAAVSRADEGAAAAD